MPFPATVVTYSFEKYQQNYILHGHAEYEYLNQSFRVFDIVLFYSNVIIFRRRNKQIGCLNYHLILLYIMMHHKKDLIRSSVLQRKFSIASTTALTKSF